MKSSCPVQPFQPMQSVPTEKILKKPIPDEHLVLKTTFEGLIQKCLAVATDPVSLSDGDNSSVYLYVNRVNKWECNCGPFDLFTANKEET